MKRTDLNATSHLRLLFYGLPGSTKTRTAASAALDDRMWPVLHIDAGGNPLSVRDYARQPDVLTLESLADLTWIYNWLRRGMKPDSQANELGLLTDGPYKTLVFDGISHFQQIVMQQVTGGQLRGVGEVPPRIERQHYGAVLAVMTQFAHSFYQLPMHVIVTALEREEMIGDEKEKRTYVRPLIVGQSADLIPSYAYVIARVLHTSRVQVEEPRVYAAANRELTAAGDSSVMIFKPDAYRYAKDQYGKLGAYMVAPTMTKIFDLIYPDSRSK